MSSRRYAKATALLLFAGGILFPISARAFPFETTPEGLTAYLNDPSRTWDSGSKFRFFNPRKCELDRVYADTPPHYQCYFDYEEETALGIRTCINDRAWYTMYSEQYFKDNKPKECSPWRRGSSSSSEPDPVPGMPSQESSEASTAQSSPPNPVVSNGDITIKDYQLLVGGGILFLVGGCFGALFSILLNRK